MKLISWNVNGLRACLGKGFMDFFTQEQADIFALQETKMQQGQAQLPLEGYYEYWNSTEKKGYSGTAVFTKKEPLSVRYGLGIEEHDHEGRVISLEFENFWFVTVYTPNSQRDLARLEYRMTWEDAFRAYLKELEKSKPVIVCGDMNVCSSGDRSEKPKTNTRNAGFTQEERDKMTQLLDSGFCDTFRRLYPDCHRGVQLVELYVQRQSQQRGMAHRLLSYLRAADAKGAGQSDLYPGSGQRSLPGGSAAGGLRASRFRQECSGLSLTKEISSFLHMDLLPQQKKGSSTA